MILGHVGQGLRSRLLKIEISYNWRYYGINSKHVACQYW